jgi:hypothetical protein
MHLLHAMMLTVEFQDIKHLFFDPASSFKAHTQADECLMKPAPSQRRRRRRRRRF